MSTRVLQAARSAVLAVALAALVGTTSGQVKPRVKALPLTAMDYIEIRQLVNRYAFALDTGSNNGYDYALSALFSVQLLSGAATEFGFMTHRGQHPREE
jgi:hypothetical protein